MIFLHEIHEVIGTREDEFEAAFRDEWMPLLAKGDEARLLYFLHHAHGSGVSYNVVTITAVRDAGGWGALATRIDSGDLHDWATRVDGLRHDVRGKLLIPLPWSPLQEIDLASVPSTPDEHELGLFMEDTVWPFEGRLEEYVERSGSHYAKEMKTERSERLLSVDASFRTAIGSHLRREIVLWQKIIQPRALRPLLSREVPARFKQPGGWMHDALSLRDRWESKLLRSSSWSPWY